MLKTWSYASLPANDITRALYTGSRQAIDIHAQY